MKCLLSSNTMLLLNLTHPAVRGLHGRSAALSCSSLLLYQKSYARTINSVKKAFPSSAFITHKHVQSKHFISAQLPKSNIYCMSSLVPVSLKRHPHHLVNVNSMLVNQVSAIHHQQPDGDKQAQHVFILSPKGLFNASPESWKPYLNLMRLDRPIGTWLLFLPCTWSISLAAAPGCFPDYTMLALFALGSFFMRGAGCTINDMWDKDIDAKVTRTKDRPLAAGQLTNFKALTFLGLQLSVSLAILLTMNWNTILLGTFAMVPVVIYPLMKRITYWPQIFLGLTFNWGAFMGWCAVQGSPNLDVCLPLYVSGIAWTLLYDTIYAHQDKNDDIMIGVKSTALKLGENTKPWLLGFGSVMVGGLTTVGILCEQTLPYYLGVSGIAAHLLYQIVTVDLNDGDDCAEKFRSNRNLGIMFWIAIMTGNLLKREKNEEQSPIPTS